MKDTREGAFWPCSERGYLSAVLHSFLPPLQRCLWSLYALGTGEDKGWGIGAVPLGPLVAELAQAL